MDYQEWIERNINRIKKKYQVEGFWSESEARDEPFVFTSVNGVKVANVGTDHVFRNNGGHSIEYVEDFILKVMKKNPKWK